MNNLYFLKNYNNYFNRIVRRLDNLNDYLTKVGDDGYFLLENTNFVPNDGVSTFQVAGSSSAPFTDEWQPDYCLVVNPNNDKILSRWYVIEFVRLMSGQYRATFKRDTPADKIIPLIYAPAYIIKAILPDNDPMIVNSEKMMLNQIKIREYYLKDKSHVPWVVCYIPQERDSVISVDVKTDLPPRTDIPELSSDPDMSEFFLPDGQLRTEFSTKELNDLDIRVSITARLTTPFIPTPGYKRYDALISKRDQKNGGDILSGGDLFYGSIYDAGDLANKTKNFAIALNDRYQELFNFIKAGYDNVLRSETIDGPVHRPEPNKIWQHNGKFYKFTADIKSQSREPVYASVQGDLLWNIAQPIYTGYIREETNTYTFFNAKVTTYNYKLELLQAGDAHYDIPVDTKHCSEVPYDIIAFPLGEAQIVGGVKTIRSIAMSAGRSLALAQGQCYDVQILPFCPYPELLDDNGNIDPSKGEEDKDFIYVKYKDPENAGEILTIGLIPPSAFKSIKIEKLGLYVGTDDEVDVSNVLNLRDRKEQNETDMWRVCSPNYGAMFEFNLAKIVPLGRDHISYFDVNITYRPYTPYIRIAPEFNFLYGQNYEDARGLICNGQFSITLTDDKFLTYELQNKNYQQMFNREISNLETNRQIQREQEQWYVTQAGINLGIATGAGVAIGIGNALGAISDPAALMGGFAAIGGITKSATGLVGAKKSQQWNERAYQEQRDFKVDMFNLQLDNIKALPATITQASAISYNFKFFPVLEYYTCTAQEKQAFRNKIKYNGMTVGRIGSISEFLSDNEERYVQGQLIRIEGLGEDAHLAQDLYDELLKGLFFEPYTPSNKEI